MDWREDFFSPNPIQNSIVQSQLISFRPKDEKQACVVTAGGDSPESNPNDC